MPVTVRTRKVFRGRIRQGLYRTGLHLLRLLEYDFDHPEKALFTPDQRAAVVALRTTLQVATLRTEPR